MKKFVKCIDNKIVETQLTIGKMYIVLSQSPEEFYITNNNGNNVYYYKRRFEVVEEPKPEQSESPKTLRDEIAMAAMTAEIIRRLSSGYVLKEVVELAYKIADAMMEERKK